MGFVSPAQDYVEDRLSLDRKLINKPAATFFMRAGATYLRDGIIQGALLIVDRSLKACDGSLLICSVNGELCIKRYRIHPHPHLINLENGKREGLSDHDTDSSPVFGVITYVINDARLGEFDDCPVM
ncbi:S24 family peptidase [Citrobacter freundii]|uniref:HumD family translesion DNA polymerase n=1 Tax=Citrobacter freundii TaxID=546 RepID=UPI000B5A771B|nr:S24 family peptidase [Citrobacter freundii]ASK00127.1 DNA polymerase V [Citrobacter freundii]MBS9487577.1 LexA family transcriptional regulator [Citrobacter braakii]OYQ96092.1 DNA polymerase V [Citrobacter freundii]